MLFFINKKKKVLFSKEKDRLNSFWIETVPDSPKTSPANAHCPLGTINFSNILDIDNFLVEKTAFLIVNE